MLFRLDCFYFVAGSHLFLRGILTFFGDTDYHGSFINMPHH